jgi:hypothetical protein
VAAGAAWGFGIGMLIDYRREGRTTVFVGTTSTSAKSRAAAISDPASLSVVLRFSF